MKLSEIFNVDLDLYARNKDYSKYRLPPLSQFFGTDYLNLEEYSKLKRTEPDDLNGSWLDTDQYYEVHNIVDNNNVLEGSFQQQGESLDFDGVDDYISLPSNFTLNKNSATLEVWVCINDFTAHINRRDAVMIVNKSGTHNYSFIGLRSSGVKGETNTNKDKIKPNFNIKEKEWFHITFVFDSGTVKVFKNGERVGSTTIEDDLIFDRIGHKMDSGDWEEHYPSWFDGKMKEFRIWSDVRTQTEIKNNKDNKLNGDEEGLVLYYQMSEGSGDTVYDKSGNGNDGTINGASWVTDHLLNWQQVNNGDSIPQISEGDSFTDKFLWVKQELLTNDISKTPSLDSLTVEIKSDS